MSNKRHKHRRPPVPLERAQVGMRGAPYRRVCALVTKDNREYTLHATKGFRSERIAQ